MDPQGSLEPVELYRLDCPTDEEEHDNLLFPPLSSEPAAAVAVVEHHGYVNRMRRAFGYRFLGFMVVSQLVGKGLVRAVADSLMLPLFKNVAHVDARALQLYTLMIMLPWAIKPIIGLLSDYVLIAGYNKRGWLVLACLAGSAASALLFASRGMAIVFCLMGINLQLAVYDLLAEGKAAQLRNENAWIGTSGTTFMQMLEPVGALMALSFVGVVSDRQLYWVDFGVLTALCALHMGPTLWGWLPEERLLTFSWVQLVGTDRLRSEWRSMLVIAFCGLASVVTSTMSGLLADVVPLVVPLCVSVAFLVACLVGSWWAFPPGITYVAVYRVLVILSQPVIGTALDYFYTASPECLPDGPHFSYVYYQTYAGIVGNAIYLLGGLFFERFLSGLRVRPVLIITTVVGGLAGLSDLFIVTRANVALGIPDAWAYMVGEAVVEPLIGMLNWIPSMALIAMAAPKGQEASSFAFIAGLANFARMTSELSGALAFSAAGVTTVSSGNGGGCNFAPLPYLVFLCHVTIPIMVGVPAVFIVPDVRQDEATIDNRDCTARPPPPHPPLPRDSAAFHDAAVPQSWGTNRE
jgi:hypothetical protein